MNQLTNVEIKMTSLDISEIVGKRHDHVMRDIRNEIKALGDEIAAPIFGEGTYTDKNNQERPCYIFGKDGAMQLALKYDAKTRFKVIKRIEEMEKQIAKPQSEDDKLQVQKQRVEAMLLNARARQAKLIFDVTQRFRDRLPDVTIESLIAAGTKTLTGQELLPSPKVEQKFYTCAEIARGLGAMSKKGIPHNKAIAALIKHIGFDKTEVVTVVESTGPWQGTTDKYANSVITRLKQKLDELGYPSVLKLDKSFKIDWKIPA